MLAKQAEMKYHFFSMSRKAQAMIDQIDALPQRDKRELWEELGRRLEQSSEVESDPELEKALLEGITSGPIRLGGGVGVRWALHSRAAATQQSASALSGADANVTVTSRQVCRESLTIM